MATSLNRSRSITNQQNELCAWARLRSAFASTVWSVFTLHFMACPGLSESLLGYHVLLLQPRFETVGAILDLPCPSVILWFRHLSNENLSSHFSQKLWGLEGWNLVHTWTMGGWVYRVYRIQAAAAYLSLYFFIFFLSNFQTLNIFITLFSGTVRPRRFKLGAHLDDGWMYRVP